MDCGIDEGRNDFWGLLQFVGTPEVWVEKRLRKRRGDLNFHRGLV